VAILQPNIVGRVPLTVPQLTLTYIVTLLESQELSFLLFLQRAAMLTLQALY